MTVLQRSIKVKKAMNKTVTNKEFLTFIFLAELIPGETMPVPDVAREAVSPDFAGFLGILS